MIVSTIWIKQGENNTFNSDFIRYFRAYSKRMQSTLRPFLFMGCTFKPFSLIIHKFFFCFIRYINQRIRCITI